MHRTLTVRRGRFLVGMLALLGGAVLFYLCQRSSGPVTRANYDRIRMAMTLADVETLLGCPGEELGPLGFEDLHADEQLPLILQAPQPHRLRSWTSTRHKISVIFDGGQRVIGKSFSRSPGANSLHKLLDWLGL